MTSLERRVDAIESLQLDRRLTKIESKVDAIESKVDAHRRVTNALAQQTAERFNKVDDQFSRVDDGFAGVRATLDQFAAGQDVITQLLTRLIDRENPDVD